MTNLTGTETGSILGFTICSAGGVVGVSIKWEVRNQTIGDVLVRQHIHNSSFTGHATTVIGSSHRIGGCITGGQSTETESCPGGSRNGLTILEPLNGVSTGRIHAEFQRTAVHTIGGDGLHIDNRRRDELLVEENLQAVNTWSLIVPTGSSIANGDLTVTRRQPTEHNHIADRTCVCILCCNQNIIRRRVVFIRVLRTHVASLSAVGVFHFDIKVPEFQWHLNRVDNQGMTSGRKTVYHQFSGPILQGVIICSDQAVQHTSGCAGSTRTSTPCTTRRELYAHFGT